MVNEEPDQVWEQEVDGCVHRVETSGSIIHRVRWLTDGVEVASTVSSNDRVRLRAAGRTLLVKHSARGRPQRASIADTDLRPAPGSPAAAFEQRVLDHPTRYSVLAGIGGVATVLLPFLGVAVVTLLWRVVRPRLPDLPRVPWPDLPDLPDIPWPDLPDIPWPDLPSIPWASLPDWVLWTLDHAHSVGPVVVALVLARLEVRRRRDQAARRRPREDDGEEGHGSAP